MAGDLLAGGRIAGNGGGGGSGHAGLLVSRRRAAARLLHRNVDPIGGGNKASAYPVTCTYLSEWGLLQGCALHPQRQLQQPKQQQQRAIRGMARWVRLRETP
ncbi:hypothetical protein SMJ63A_30310 [Stenotrophomonas geniculata]